MLVDWTKIPEKFKYFAIDQDGDAYYYAVEPVLEYDRGEYFWTVDQENEIQYAGSFESWSHTYKSSLQTRQK